MLLIRAEARCLASTHDLPAAGIKSRYPYLSLYRVCIIGTPQSRTRTVGSITCSLDPR